MADEPRKSWQFVRARFQPCRLVGIGGWSGFSRCGMAVPSRHGNHPGTYFITSRTWESRALFLKEPACRIWVER